jgi:hypothetical protein
MWRSSQNSLDKPLEEAVADTIAFDLIDGNVHVLDRRDLARRAALEAFRQAIELAAKTLADMAANHELSGEWTGAASLREAERQVRTLPGDVP